jgi:hypothetical protein
MLALVEPLRRLGPAAGDQVKRATKAPPLIRPTSPGAAGELEEGTRWATSNRGAIRVGVLVHELPREVVEIAYRERVLFDPIEVLEVLPK